MSSPRNIGGSIREGTRVVLKEITATLHNSTLNNPHSRKSNGNDSPVPKTAEHEVKVRFAREFADVGSVTCSAPESLSSASSFHSLSSTLSTKSSSGICPDLISDTPDDIANTSYVNTNIPGVEDLILACAEIRLGSEQSFDNLPNSSQDFSQDQSFASATNESLCHIEDIKPDNAIGNETRIIETNPQSFETTNASLNQTVGLLNSTSSVTQLASTYSLAKENIPQIEESTEEPIVLQKNDNTVNEFETCSSITNNTVKDSLPTSNVDDNQLNVTITVSSDNTISTFNEEQTVENNHSSEALSLEDLKLCSTEISTPEAQLEILLPHYSSLSNISSVSSSLEDADIKAKENSLHDLSKLMNDSSIALSTSDDIDEKLNVLPPIIVNNSIIQTEKNKVIKEQDLLPLVNHIVSDNKEDNTQLNKIDIIESETAEIQKNLQISVDIQDLEIKDNTILNETQILLAKEDIAICNDILIIEQRNPSETVIIEENLVKSKASANVKEKGTSLIAEDLDCTLTLQEIENEDFITTSDEDQYLEFKPQRQSTTLFNKERVDFAKLESTVKEVTNDLLNPSPKLAEGTDQFFSATSKIFEDPSAFDFLLAQSNPTHTNRLRTESLYIKFDPCNSLNTSMLPQGNAQPINEEQNGKNELQLPNVDTPKRNPAIAAIDRLLLYSPLPSAPVQKFEETQEKNEQPVEESKSDAPLIAPLIDVDMAKELELVRAMVLQLEEQLEKQKKEHEIELERQKTVFQEKINKLQSQIVQEIKIKNQYKIAMEEYEKSISTSATEQEKDRMYFEQEKMKLQEELQSANHHLSNTEAAFNDVHQKYEKLKGVVLVYKNNEAVLKESVKENGVTINTLEMKYNQLKEHAVLQLDKANKELAEKQSQHEAETKKLHAMIRKAELQNNSLAEMVEQKNKEIRGLSNIVDEFIGRVGNRSNIDDRNPK